MDYQVNSLYGVVPDGSLADRNNIIKVKQNTPPAGIYLLKVNNRNTRTRCEICSKLTIKTPERRRP